MHMREDIGRQPGNGPLVGRGFDGWQAAGTTLEQNQILQWRQAVRGTRALRNQPRAAAAGRRRRALRGLAGLFVRKDGGEFETKQKNQDSHVCGPFFVINMRSSYHTPREKQSGPSSVRPAFRCSTG